MRWTANVKRGIILFLIFSIFQFFRSRIGEESFCLAASGVKKKILTLFNVRFQSRNNANRVISYFLS
jgi:hypothetical protein